MQAIATPDLPEVLGMRWEGLRKTTIGEMDEMMIDQHQEVA